MLNLSLNEIVEYINVVKIYKTENFNKIFINHISTNSKNILKNTIFIALKGKKFDGHHFISEAIYNGAIAIICDLNHESFFKKYIFKIPIIIIKDAYLAMGNLAMKYRELYLKNVKFIAVTGSVGKTTTKEMISSILSTEYKISKTEKNFNNLIGVSKTIFNTSIKDNIAIIELGMSNKNELNNLTKIVKPNIIVITNIGCSHIENFNSKLNILKAKLEITNYMKKEDILILNNDDPLLNKIKINRNKLEYSLNNDNSDIYTKKIILNTSSTFDVYYNKELYIKNCKLPITGKHNISNILCSILIGKIFNIKKNNIKMAIQNFKNIELRQKKYYCKDNIFIEDCYNASPESMKASFNILDQYFKFKILILGSMNELGRHTKKFHSDIGALAEEKADFIIFLGNSEIINYYKIKIKNKKKCIEFSTCNEIINYLKNSKIKNSVILIKGSRSNHMEEIMHGYNIL